MTSISPKIRAGCAAALVLSLAACGGGGGGGGGFPVAASGTGSAGTGSTGTGSTDTGDTTTAAKLSGVAATGAAFSGATITVVDQTGTTVCTTQTDSAGAYACTLPASTKAPLVIKAVRDDQTLYSTTASAAGGTANVTPLTTIIVAELSPDGNPASLAGAIQTDPAAVTADTIRKQTDDLVAAIAPLLSALGLAAIDPCAVRIALLHYSPIEATLAGEPERLWLVLGADRLAGPIRQYRPQLVVHGHAHNGSFEGDVDGVPVYNVAVHVIGREFWVFELDAEHRAGAQPVAVEET